MRPLTATKLLLLSIACASAFTVPEPALVLRRSTSSSSPSSPSSSSSWQNQRRRRISSLARSSSPSSASSTSTSGSGSGSGGGQQDSSSSSSSAPQPSTFREGEVLGLRLMQDGRHDEALKAFKLAMTLPGSRPDILRTANVPGPSPVGGSKGGTEGRRVQNLDEFESQAGHYNMACAYASLGNVSESVSNLRKAFEFGFNSYVTVRSDPDLVNVRDTTEFGRLMDEYDPRNRMFNPFGVFGK